MKTFILWANTQWYYSDLPSLPPKQVSEYPKVRRRQACRKLAYFLLTQALNKLNISPHYLNQVTRLPNGRPHFPLSHVDYNLSHSGDWVAIIIQQHAFHSKSPIVGIDIEFPEKQRNYRKLLHYYASVAEQDWFITQPNSHRAFYQTWCLREAVLKTQGVGLVHLSKVIHLPKQHRIYSNDCPRGKLLFIDELPFYLAAFVGQASLAEIEFLTWHETTQELITRPLQYQCYQVNPIG